MTEIVNHDKLTLILTDYGIRRIQEVTGTTIPLNITKIRLGSGNNYEYYEPDPSQEALKGDLDLEFYIYDKQLLEDGLTTSFHTIIPDDISGFDIREVGLYETHNGEDRLFAISTQQPFVKPFAKDNYFININYYIFLKSQNLANIYDQITLDVEHAQVTEPDLEELMRTFLFSQGNLINQINENSTIIGYNRATQLYEKIQENKKTYSYITLYKNFASLTNVLASPDDIFSYWVFDYSRRLDSNNSIVDISKNGNNLSTNTSLNNLNRVYRGFTSMFSFSSPNYFKLSSQIPLNLFDPSTNMDIPFTMVFVVDPLDSTSEKTLIAKSDYARRLHSIEVKELPDKSVSVRLFSDSNSYLTFKTVQNSVPIGAHSIVINYDPTDKKMTFFINSTKYIVTGEETGRYTHISESTGLLYAFTCAPEYIIYALQENGSPTLPLFYKNNTNNFLVYKGSDWTLSNEKIYYKGNEASIDLEVPVQETGNLYGWVPVGTPTLDNVVYTKILPSTNDGFTEVPTLYNSDYEVYMGEDFGVELNTANNKYIIKFYRDGDSYNTVHDPNPQDSKDILSKQVYCYKYTMEPAIIFTNNEVNPTVLYTRTEDDEYINYAGDEWKIENNKIYRLDQLATYTPESDVETNSPDLTSYIINEQGIPSKFINSNVGVISIIKEALSDENARILSLNLCATLGINPYLGGF